MLWHALFVRSANHASSRQRSPCTALLLGVTCTLQVTRRLSILMGPSCVVNHVIASHRQCWMHVHPAPVGRRTVNYRRQQHHTLLWACSALRPPVYVATLQFTSDSSRSTATSAAAAKPNSRRDEAGGSCGLLPSCHAAGVLTCSQARCYCFGRELVHSIKTACRQPVNCYADRACGISTFADEGSELA